MAFSLYRGDRRYREYDIEVKDRAGQVVQLAGGVKAAMVPTGSRPNASTVWTTVTPVEGAVLVLLCGPEAAPSGEPSSLVVPLEGASLFFLYEDEPELEADFVEDVSVK